MKTKEKINKMLCTVADNVVLDGKSFLTWGEKEIPNSLRRMYENKQEENNYETN